jgi:hypothetical protein
MKEKARQQGHFPEVAEQSMNKQLLSRIKDFQQNAELGAMLARRRMWQESMQYRNETENALAQNTEARTFNLRGGMAAAVGAERMRDEIVNPTSPEGSGAQPKAGNVKLTDMLPRDERGTVKPGTGLTE